MENFLLLVQAWGPGLAQLFVALCVVATVVIRLPGVKGKEDTDGIVAKVIKVIQWLPTIGINPKTKALEDALNDLKKS